MTMLEMQRETCRINREKGFHDGRRPDGRDDTLVRLCLIHTEVSEAAQEVKRHGVGEPGSEQRAKLVGELADILIRTFDLGELLGADLGQAVQVKLHLNASRPRRHNTAPHAVGC